MLPNTIVHTNHVLIVVKYLENDKINISYGFQVQQLIIFNIFI